MIPTSDTYLVIGAGLATLHILFVKWYLAQAVSNYTASAHIFECSTSDAHAADALCPGREVSNLRAARHAVASR